MKVAAVQAEPAWWNLKAGVAKTISIIKEAASNGTELIGFPESFIPGYPLAIWTQGFNPEFLAKYRENSLSVQSDEFKEILAATKEAGIWVVLGFTEREGGSTYGGQVIINSDGVVVVHRRKIKVSTLCSLRAFQATGQERTIWGDGPADSVQNVVDGPNGIKVGALNCWEHLQPLLRYHTYSQGVQIHVSSWPLFISKTEHNALDAQSSSESNAFQSKFTAMEGQTFVISSTQTLKAENVEIAGVKGKSMWEKGGGGFAAIYGPDGTQLTPPTKRDEEIILYADIDLNDIKLAKLLADPVGHYSRPDLLSLKVNATPRPNVIKGDSDGSEATLLKRLHGA